MELELLAIIAVSAFVFQTMDASFGSGFGTLSVPFLILLGLPVIDAVFITLITNAIVGIIGGFAFHYLKVADLREKKNKRLLFSVLIPGLIGTIVAVFSVVNIPPIVVELYIALLLIILGIYVIAKKIQAPDTLTKLKRWWKERPKNPLSLSLLYAFAGFNKGMGGGGYGMVATSGMLLSQIKPRRAVTIVMITEAILSVSAILLYIFLDSGATANYAVLAAMIIGALPAFGVAAPILKKISARILSVIIGIATIGMGILMVTLEIY